MDNGHYLGNACVVDLLGLHPYCISSNNVSKTDCSHQPMNDSRFWLQFEAKRLVSGLFGRYMGRYLWYSNNFSRFPNERDKPLPNRSIKNCTDTEQNRAGDNLGGRQPPEL